VELLYFVYFGVCFDGVIGGEGKENGFLFEKGVFWLIV
jgi:hypothetical protein